MEGRYPNGLIFCNTNCTDPFKKDEFNNWYSHMHVPDVTAPGIFTSGIRYINPDPQPAQSQYVVTYETEWENVDKASEALIEYIPAWRERGRYTPYLEIFRAGPYKKIGGEFRAADRPMRGILAVLTNCLEPAREADFNRWYDDVHIPDILGSGLCHAAYRYEIASPEVHEVKPVNGEAIKGKYLAIYETDSEDPVATAEQLKSLNEDWKLKGHGFDGPVEVVYQIAAKRFWPKI